MESCKQALQTAWMEQDKLRMKFVMTVTLWMEMDVNQIVLLLLIGTALQIASISLFVMNVVMESGSLQLRNAMMETW